MSSVSVSGGSLCCRRVSGESFLRFVVKLCPHLVRCVGLGGTEGGTVGRNTGVKRGAVVVGRLTYQTGAGLAVNRGSSVNSCGVSLHSPMRVKGGMVVDGSYRVVAADRCVSSPR